MHEKEQWLELYKLHFGQASCAAKDIFAMLDAFKTHPELSDAVILAHSDHGSRIILKGHEDPKDWRGSFIALRMPGMKARVIDTPVRLDRLYKNLLENNFTKLDLDQLGPLEDSPYRQ